MIEQFYNSTVQQSNNQTFQQINNSTFQKLFLWSRINNSLPFRNEFLCGGGVSSINNKSVTQTLSANFSVGIYQPVVLPSNIPPR